MPTDLPKTKHLFLLIGANPLPNYVAGMLMAKDNATIYLLCSPGAGGTTKIAERLKTVLRYAKSTLKDEDVRIHEIDENDSNLISQTALTLLEGLDGSVGLNYTGGTKPMALHVYRAIQEKEFEETVYSYLDARKLKMFIDARCGNPPQSFCVGNAVELSLENLFALHGYELKMPRPAIDQPRFCGALAQVHSTTKGFADWRKYLETPLDPLPTIERYPNLEPVIREIGALCGDMPPTPNLVARAFGFGAIASCAKFFAGGWLEEYTFAAISQIAGDLSIKHCKIGLEAYKPGKKDREFEIDVAAVLGYQLFAISCMATDKKEKAQEHLFEIYVRARQLGGDEARLGLVCCVANPQRLQEEIEYQWDAKDKVRVFGAPELMHLAEHLRDWFVKANKGLGGN